MTPAEKRMLQAKMIRQCYVDLPPSLKAFNAKQTLTATNIYKLDSEVNLEST